MDTALSLVALLAASFVAWWQYVVVRELRDIRREVERLTGRAPEGDGDA